MEVFHYGSDRMSIGIAMDLCAGKRKGILGRRALERIHGSRQRVEKVIADNAVVYGITTGFGALYSTLIDPADATFLQHNLLKSHAAGIGDPVEKVIAKLMMILKVHALAQGFSGICESTLRRILWHIDEDVIPVVPCQGSVGASGDLAPLAHLFLPLLGLGEVLHKGTVYPAAAVLRAHGLEPLELQAKEGLALINGTQFMAAYGIWALYRFQTCLDQSDLIAATMVEALQGSLKPFTRGIHDIRPHTGVQYVARRMYAFLNNSEIMQSHIDCDRIQDPYSLRCIPQVHGTSREAYKHVREAIETEINSVTDNPIILETGEIISGGNFHGQTIALPLDYLAMAAAEMGNISDRRIYLAFDGKYEGVPTLLMKETGLNSGFMIIQYTTASLVTENKAMCFPASVDSIPTSRGQEDHVSMGSVSGRKCLQVIKNFERILALEMLCAAQALDFRRPLQSSPWIAAVHELIRAHIAHREKDDLFEADITSAVSIIQKGALTGVVRKLGSHDPEVSKHEQHEVFGIY